VAALERLTDPRKSVAVWAAAVTATTLLYLLIFFITREQPLAFQLKAVARNILSLALTAWIMRAVLVRWGLTLTGLRFWAAQATLALSFTLLWAWLLNLTSGLIGSGSPVRFAVSPVLAGAAVTWQLLQGLFVYVAIAALTMLERRPRGAIILLSGPADESRAQFLLRVSDDLVALAVNDIVSITGADDYSELTTTAGRHLVTTPLTEFEALLSKTQFVRVHRSAIANLNHVQRAEPLGGGRMILRMDFGADLPVSRTGARLLRAQAL
jgi:hypothetical protein